MNVIKFLNDTKRFSGFNFAAAYEYKLKFLEIGL